jgi:hypothetical protein
MNRLSGMSRSGFSEECAWATKKQPRDSGPKAQTGWLLRNDGSAAKSKPMYAISKDGSSVDLLRAK